MRIMCGLFFFIAFSGGHCDEKQIFVPVHGSPVISVLIMDSPVEYFEITKDGLVTWNTWVNEEPSNSPPKYQHSNAEYEQTLNLIAKVFEKNYMPESGVNSGQQRVIYVIKVGEFFSSLALNLEYQKDRPIPKELRGLITYINNLRQSNKSMQMDLLERYALSSATDA